jgi:hypothetical protein
VHNGGSPVAIEDFPDPGPTIEIMAIKVSCHCGASFTAKDNLAGQTLLCPKCSQPITIPSPNAPLVKQKVAAVNPMADLFDEAGFKEYKGARCPQCNSPLKPNAVLCTECGFHLQSGQKVAAAKVLKAGERGHAEATESLLDRAAQQLEADKVEMKKNQGQGLPAWVYFIALSILVGFVVTMFMIPRNRAFEITGMIISGFAYLMLVYYNIRMIIAAFSESTVCGLLFLFMPFYSLYYLVTRWDRIGGFFLMQLLYGVVAGIGIGLIALAPLMEKKEGETTGMRWTQDIRQVALLDVQSGN